MDFITHLPKVGDFEAILVIIDRFSKYATFIPATKQCSAETTAQLFFKHVVKLWGVPTSIHARGILAPFCKRKAKELGPVLDVAQFCFNAQTSSSTGRSPFEIVSGRQPVLPHLVDHPFAGKNPQALNFTKEWRQTNHIARAYLEKASKRMKKWADKKRRPLEFRAGDQVLIKLRPKQVRFRGRKDQRLVRKYEGPVEVLKKVGNTSYRVTLSTWIKIYPVIHVSNLKPYHQHGRPAAEYQREGRLRHTASLTADSDFRTADLLIELSKCRTIVLRSYNCDTVQAADPNAPITQADLAAMEQRYHDMLQAALAPFLAAQCQGHNRQRCRRVTV
ncbi:reverse transcriptase [Cucumis melo var. makuwa]|uniref:Reverse transcriptase n=1 Tax=Cucumis melo var. makuwa TaxID=1194695 RepID=A0A5A7V4H5_CUCMM|nr:reverse transcriptase [Cucumis melo var. makuwa]